MADYVRFEVYVPRHYTFRGKRHTVDPVLLQTFIQETISKYQGLTQSSPAAGPMYMGWWQQRPDGPITVDFLSLIFGLVKDFEFNEGLAHFTSWKERLEKGL